MKNRGGFTFVETLVALSISSALFVIMLVAFSGRQARIEFSQGLRDVESYIQDAANDVRTGVYPSNTNQKCDVDISGNIVFSVNPSNQGSSDKCVYAGSALLINSTGSAQSVITRYSLAGVKKTSYTSISELKPKIIGTSGNEARTDYNIPGGISLVKVDGAGVVSKTSVLTLLIFDVSGVGVDTAKKISRVNPYILPITGVDIANINLKLTDTGAFNAPISDAGITLCFRGANGQTGTITLKKGSDGINTSVQIGRSINSATGCVEGI